MIYTHQWIRSWKDGQYPDWDAPIVEKKIETLRGVHSDTTTDLFLVYKEDLVEFEDWVAMTYASENQPQLDDESNKDYLDRLDVMIIKREAA